MGCDKDCSTLQAMKQRLIAVQDLLVTKEIENKALAERNEELILALKSIHTVLQENTGRGATTTGTIDSIVNTVITEKDFD